MLLRAREVVSRVFASVISSLSDRPDKADREFIRHNRQLWMNYRQDRSQGEVLVEGNKIGSYTVAASYVGSYLARKESSKLVVFSAGLSRVNRAVYGSFADSFLRYSPRDLQSEQDALLASILPGIATKRDLEELCVDDIWIGDLVYDSYIRMHTKATVDLSSNEFVDTLRTALGYLIFWRRYFDNHDVKAVVLSHTVFIWHGIILRLTVKRGIPAYFTAANRLYYITDSHNTRSYNQYIDYPEQFARLSPEEQSRARAIAKERIELRFKGERDVGRHHLIKPTFTKKTGERVLEESPRTKVLVASHCFSDDNHVYGNNLFPDFYEWLLFLGKVSEETDYDWYIKLHPDRYDWETAHIEDFVRRFPKFRILQSDVSHHQIVEDGIDCVLTVYGTIGFEYAALGVPVITASPWNPTVAYDFNVHPKTVADYEVCLKNLPGLEHHIDINKVYEYYFCHYVLEPDNWLYDSFDRLDAEIGGGRAHIGSVSYSKFLAQFTVEKHERILRTLHNFVSSREYCLAPKHVAPSVARTDNASGASPAKVEGGDIS